MQGVSQEGKKSAVCMNWEIKRSWEFGCTMNPSMDSGEPGVKALEKFTIFSLKLV